MSKKWACWLGLAAISLASCSGGEAPTLIDINQAATGTAAAIAAGAEAQEQETATPSAEEATPEASPTPETILFSGANVSDFSSYSLTLRIDFEGTVDGEESFGTLELNNQVDAQAQAAYVEWVASGNMARTMGAGEMGMGEGATVMVYLDGVTYLPGETVPEGCAAMQGDVLALLDLTGAFSPQELLPSDLPEFSLVGPGGEVNGVQTTQYHLDAQELAEGELANASADLWVADDGSYVVRFRIEGHGSMLGEEGTEGTVTMEYNLRSVNQPLDIEVPPECQGVIPAVG
jgi:hypothetical protein